MLLWVCCNGPGTFWALVEDGLGGWKIGTSGGSPARWQTGGDMEGICQPDDSQPIVYLMDETGHIRKYDVSVGGTVNEVQSWNIVADAGPNGGSGPEGITFVPDEWLAREGFRDGSGVLRTSSQGMNGLMFVGHQTGGYVHVFDLNAAGTCLYHGKILTSRSETAGLSFDRTSGKLYIWHNTGPNYLEVAELNSTPSGAERRFRTLIEYAGPRGGNLEGIAPVSNLDGDDWIMLTDDDNNPSGEAVTIYKHFRPETDTDHDDLPDDWELRHFGSTTVTTGAADPDKDGMDNEREHAFGLDPTTGASVVPIPAPLDRAAGTFVYTRPIPELTGFDYAVQTSTAPDRWTVDPSAVQEVIGTAADLQTVRVTVGGEKPLAEPVFLVRVGATEPE